MLLDEGQGRLVGLIDRLRIAAPQAVLAAGAIAAVATVLSIVACRLALIRTQAPLRGTVVLLLLALAGALWLGSTARLWLAAAPAAPRPRRWLLGLQQNAFLA